MLENTAAQSSELMTWALWRSLVEFANWDTRTLRDRR